MENLYQIISLVDHHLVKTKKIKVSMR